ncbi:TonB-dependent receptor [Novosphingobium marinum]|uniref:Iron complex outermembrane receptor protein n=1 Tax=Novosphingobium marinum TaxID=1514948 RepID=A0A7Y9XXH8_9SPHN|nr:TonB-dependent receptor [Novosphingobium marinum]NYH96416.1 iron complex outermembrane receptor protein [Novosphingobium marinum]GGC35038.1 TonB-dependent receptor [Novosphingobium marinum]
MRLQAFLTTAASTLALGIAAAASTSAHAQSTGSVEFETGEIVVTGIYESAVGGVEIPNTPKAKQVLDDEIIRRQRPGQTANDIVNLVPGVSFQNNDPWGSSGGTFTIRGFSDDRISQTLDGLPLNDSGNYALYTNQQVDPEILAEINVNLGVTDVDSPTASATGGTINLRTKVPEDEFKLTASISYGNIIAPGAGDRPYIRGFGMIDTGDLTGMGTKAFFSASYVRYDNPFNNYGVVDKQQYNGRIFQELGSNGDFIAVAGHYNQNRNNFFGSFSVSGFPTTKRGRYYEINYPCTVDTPTPGVRDVDNNCGAEFDRRYNPSNTGNIRGSSRFTLMDGLILTVDPSFQYVKANGGGDEELLEQTRSYNGVEYTGFLRGGYYFGRDLNGDGDTLDEVTGHDPSQTKTRRYGVIASLAYDINPDHRVRVAYTWDRARHRQTGATSVALPNGEIADVFPINDPLVTADGFVLNKRNRLSYAILHQVSGEYRGNFGPLTAVLGLRAPFFKRELNQYCYTTSASGFLDCFDNQDPAAYEAANPRAAPPQSRSYKYDKLLPNVGIVYNVTDDASIFANYAKGLSVPGTDPLYDSLFFPNVAEARPVPETTDSFDAGVRFQTGTVQAQLAGWYTKYKNRLASAYDPVLDETVYRNLGSVDKYGIDGSVAWQPTPNTFLYVFGSWYDSEIKEDILTADGVIPTGGKKESGAPVFTLGARGEVTFGDFSLGAQAKHTGKRYLNDANLVLEPLGRTADGYTLVDLDLRYKLAESPMGGDVAIQLNVTNLFDEFYVSGFDGSLDSSPFLQIGAPRAFSVAILFGY